MDPDNFDFTMGDEVEDEDVSEELEVTRVIDVEATVPVDAGGSKKRKPPIAKKPKAPKEKKRPAKRRESPIWEQFNEIPPRPDRTLEGECKYCLTKYQAHSKKHGINNLRNHILSCKEYPLRGVDGQQSLSFKSVEEGVEMVSVLFNFHDSKRALAEMVIIDGLSFRFVEGIGFRRFCAILQPKFDKVPSLQTVAREIIVIYNIEKEKLKKVLTGRRVCLTTDTWSSIQNLCYMCLTAHFIDDGWKLQKRILNFCQVEDHKGETIGNKIEDLLREWKIEGVLTLTVDNASSNSTTIKCLKRKTMDWNKTFLNNEFMHMRCCAHILNLIVVDGLKEINESIVRIRNVVIYVRGSPQREDIFLKCAEKENIESNQKVCLDVRTRWNATYLMLEVVEKFEKAFNRMADEDPCFRKHFNVKELTDSSGDEEENVVNNMDMDLEGRVGGRVRTRVLRLPTKLDWKNSRTIVKFLKLFYKATKQFLRSLFVIANAYFEEIITIEASIVELISNNDPLLASMANKMKENFDKYWGDEDKMNCLLYVAVVLDPRYKLRYLKFRFEVSKGKAVSEEMEKLVTNCLKRLCEAYESESRIEVEVRTNASSSNPSPIVMMEDDNDDQSLRMEIASRFDTYLEQEYSHVCTSELDKYLMDLCENRNNPDFDLLAWWKNNTIKYPILSEIARDVLAIPVSTVSSESAFSTSGRILDQFRSSLKPSMVEALVCTQNWLLSTVPISLRKSMDEVERLEKEILEAVDDASL